MKVLVASSNNHYTNEDVKIEDNVIETEVPFEAKHAEHDPIGMIARNYVIRKVVEKAPFEDIIRRVDD